MCIRDRYIELVGMNLNTSASLRNNIESQSVKPKSKHGSAAHTIRIKARKSALSSTTFRPGNLVGQHCALIGLDEERCQKFTTAAERHQYEEIMQLETSV